MRLAALFVTLLVAPAAFAQANESARRVLDACVDSVAHDVLGMEQLEAACPGIEAALDELGLAPFLPEVQRETIGLSGLRSVQTLVQRYENPPEERSIEADSLRPVLESLQQAAQPEQPTSWLERFKRWLRQKFDRQPDSPSFFSRWLDDHPLSETARLVLLYGSMAVVVILAIVIVINEARAARSAGRRVNRKRAADAAGEEAVAIPVLGDIDRAAPADRPSMLLRVLIATLVQSGRLHTERSLTHRELTARARFDDDGQHESFQRVAELAERVVYGGDRVAADDIDEVVRAGRALHSQLSGAAS